MRGREYVNACEAVGACLPKGWIWWCALGLASEMKVHECACNGSPTKLAIGSDVDDDRP